MSPSNFNKEKMVTFRKLDANNRVSIPKKMRDALGMESDSYLQVKMENGNIVLQPVRPIG